MNKHEKNFITMMLPYCQDIDDGKLVNMDDLMIMQDTFLYTTTSDMFFLDRCEGPDLQEKREKFLRFVETLKKLDHNKDGDFFQRLPRPLGMASLWWNALAYMFHKDHPDIFESHKSKD